MLIDVYFDFSGLFERGLLQEQPPQTSALILSKVPLPLLHSPYLKRKSSAQKPIHASRPTTRLKPPPQPFAVVHFVVQKGKNSDYNLQKLCSDSANTLVAVAVTAEA